MADYIDGFAFPIQRDHIETYKGIASKVADIWRNHGAMNYQEYLTDDPALEGTVPFTKAVDAKEDEVVIFGWVTFASKEARDEANKKVANDPRVEALVAPLTQDTDRPIFDATRMVYGGFKPLL
ncbi:DUF1428 domain-containing protein [Thalassotalea euphylliae]|uniref:DUF1428 domain-containing protein n=1 Tax=Thalassotalea euphylliae TaxID=1655234 RepID=UPI00363A544E